VIELPSLQFSDMVPSVSLLEPNKVSGKPAHRCVWHVGADCLERLMFEKDVKERLQLRIFSWREATVSGNDGIYIETAKQFFS